MNLDLVQELQKKVNKHVDCSGTGYRLDGRSRSVPCECLREALYEIRLVNSGIPPRFRHLTFKDYMYKNSTTFAKIWKYIEQAEKAIETGTGLFLYGAQNTGKSMLASCIVKELITRGYDCSSCTFAGLMNNISEQDKYVGHEMTFASIDNITEVLDNLVNFKETALTHQQTNGAVSFLESVISSRATRGQPTILTSRVPINEIEKRFPSLGTTLLGNFLQVECVAGDFRGNNINEKLLREFGFDEIA